MKYRVILQPRAESDLEQAYHWAAPYAPVAAARWLSQFRSALDSLSDFPERCSLAPEGGAFEVEIRQLLFGRRPNVWRALFAIDGEDVRVLHIRRAAMQTADPEDL